MLTILFLIGIFALGMYIEYKYSPRIDIKDSHVYWEVSIMVTKQTSITGYTRSHVREQTKLF